MTDQFNFNKQKSGLNRASNVGHWSNHVFLSDILKCRMDCELTQLKVTQVVIVSMHVIIRF